MKKILKRIAISSAVGFAVLLVIVFLSQALFGDILNEDTFKPLWVAIPVFIAVFFTLRYFSEN